MRKTSFVVALLTTCVGLAFGQTTTSMQTKTKSTTGSLDVWEVMKRPDEAAKGRQRLRNAAKSILDRVQPFLPVTEADALGSTRKGDEPEKYVAEFGHPDVKGKLPEDDRKFMGDGVYYVYYDPGVVIEFNGRIRSERVQICRDGEAGARMWMKHFIGEVQSNPSGNAATSAAPGKKIWRGVSRNQAKLIITPVSEEDIDGINTGDFSLIEKVAKKKLTFFLVTIDNTSGKQTFSYNPGTVHLLSADKTRFDGELLFLMGTDLSDKAKEMMQAREVDPRDSRQVLLCVTNKVQPGEITMIEFGGLFSPDARCE